MHPGNHACDCARQDERRGDSLVSEHMVWIKPNLSLRREVPAGSVTENAQCCPTRPSHSTVHPWEERERV